MKNKLTEYAAMELHCQSRRTRGIVASFVGLVLISYMLRGLVAPWSYGFFNYTINWLHGYIARGFLGTILHLVFGELAWSQTFLTLLQYGMEFLLLGYLLYMIYRLFYREFHVGAMLPFIVFTTSTFSMFYFQEIGFLDHWVYLYIAIFLEIALKCQAKTVLIWGGIFSILTVLTLSTGAFAGCPVIASITAIRLVREEDRLTLDHIRRLVITFVPTVLFILIFQYIPTSPQAVDTVWEKFNTMPYGAHQMDFIFEIFRSNAIASPLADTWIYFEPAVVGYMVLLIALTLLYLYFTKASSLMMGLYAMLSAASGLMGYATNYIAADYHRYYFMAVFSIFLISLYVLRLPRKQKLKIWQLVVMLVVVALILPDIFGYRLWAWNRTYRDFWFMRFF